MLLVSEPDNRTLGTVKANLQPGDRVVISMPDGVSQNFQVARIEACLTVFKHHEKEPALDRGSIAYCRYIGQNRTLKSHPVLGDCALED